MSDSRRLYLTNLLLLSLFVLVSCSDDDNPVKPPFQFTATLETLWPHDDGNSWTYNLTSEECEHPESAFYETIEDIPPIPPIEDLYARLRNGIPCDQPDNSSGSLSLIFDGEVAISPGDTVQRLNSLVEADKGWPTTPLPLVGRLWSMGQDRIVGYPDWKNDDWISWVYLTAELEPGDEFVYQLHPQFSDNLYLYGKIWRHVQHKLPDQTVVNCAECFYLYDGGILQATDENGQLLGYTRSYIYGVVLYGENIGPIICREQREGATGGLIQDPTGFRFTVDSRAYLKDWVSNDEDKFSYE